MRLLAYLKSVAKWFLPGILILSFLHYLSRVPNHRIANTAERILIQLHILLLVERHYLVRLFLVNDVAVVVVVAGPVLFLFLAGVDDDDDNVPYRHNEYSLSCLLLIMNKHYYYSHDNKMIQSSKKV